MFASDSSQEGNWHQNIGYLKCQRKSQWHNPWKHRPDIRTDQVEGKSHGIGVGSSGGGGSGDGESDRSTTLSSVSGRSM